MADKDSVEGSSTSVACGESSESSVDLNIKTLDSQIYTFNVDKNMPVSEFKEKIASEIDLPVGQQRLIFRGKVLKDEHLLSEYHVESGHTLHLVARQPSQSQLSSDTNPEDQNANNNRGQDTSAGTPHNRIGQITHSVVLGTLNVGDQGDGAVPDLSRVIGAVLNSFGIGGQATPNGMGAPQPNTQAQGNGTEGTGNNDGPQHQARNQAQSGQAFPNQSLPLNFQMPRGVAIPVPSLNAPIPDSLDTLSEFMSRMELALSQNGQPNQSPPSRGDLPRVQLPSNSRGFSTPESLSTVLRHAQRLLSDRAITALSHIAGRLEQEGGSTDPAVRGQIQTESTQVGLAMQHFGALFLELGRTILTLRMGQSPAESYVNSGPAVYISPSGPNPMMVQPFPLQSSSLFAGSAAAPHPLNLGTIGPVGIGNVPRHVNIHIHTAVGTRATNGEGVQGERVSGTHADDSGQTRVPPPRNVFAAAVPSQTSISSGLQPAGSVSQPLDDPFSLSAAIAEASSQLRGLVDNMQSETQVLSDQLDLSTAQNSSFESGANGAGAGPSLFSCPPKMEGQKTHSECHPCNDEGAEGGLNSNTVSSSSSAGGSHGCSSEEKTLKSVNDSESAPRSGHGNDNPEGASAVPLGLGLGGLQPKRRSRQTRQQSSNSDSGTSSASHNQNQQAGTNGQQVLQSLASGRNANTLASGQLPPALGPTMGSVPLGGQSAGGQIDASNVMSQVIHSPALNGLLAGVSQQTGVGSPDVLRNMLEQLTQSPEMRNTVNQIAQQVDSQDIGNMFSGFGMGQGGGFDLSRMVQQMMPIVSQALSGGSIASQPTTSMAPTPQYNERARSRDVNTDDPNSQIDLQQVVQRIQNQNPPREIFQAIVENAVQLCDDGTSAEDLLDELCSEGLASEYLEILHHDVSRRVGGRTGSAEEL